MMDIITGTDPALCIEVPVRLVIIITILPDHPHCRTAPPVLAL